jgi:hypothetical protein
MESNLIQEESLVKKWSPILEHADLAPINDPYRKMVTAVLMENQEKNKHLHETAPANATGAGIANWDPVLIGMIRRSTPYLIGFDIAGVQPMTLPTGLVFAMRSRYSAQAGTEALFNEANTAFSGTGTHLTAPVSLAFAATLTNASANVTVTDTSKIVVGSQVWSAAGSLGTVASITSGTVFVLSAAYAGTSGTVNISLIPTTGTGMATSTGESDITGQMALSVEKVTVSALTRQLKAEYSIELQQDLQAVHGLDAESELANILSNEIITETNREILRQIYSQATLGARADTAVPGRFNLATDSDGRWASEKFKGLHFSLERDANGIMVDTKRGKGNFVVVSADVASALNMAGLMLGPSGLGNGEITSDFTTSTMVGTLKSGMKVYVDPYATNNFYCVGYKGTSPWDAGYFYCPYVPLTMYRATDPTTFQPKIAFKTRYGQTANPLFGGGTRTNSYYRVAEVANLV